MKNEAKILYFYLTTVVFVLETIMVTEHKCKLLKIYVWLLFNSNYVKSQSSGLGYPEQGVNDIIRIAQLSTSVLERKIQER
jgi:hypothetical protein